jgi:hypothetical protein
MADRQRRRLAIIARHLAPEGADSTITTSHAALSSSQCAAHSTSNATSGARKLSSYERVHGSVSRDIPAWVPVPQPAGQEFQDILYEKSASDGIAKVNAACNSRALNPFLRCLIFR